MKRVFALLCTAAAVAACCGTAPQHTPNSLRPSAYPLITIDPYTSGWAFTDNLCDGTVRHWTGDEFPLTGVLRVDGKCYRFMGRESAPVEELLPTADQAAWSGRYTTSEPAADWMQPAFDDRAWKRGEGAFGLRPGDKSIRTPWHGDRIWVRRTFDLAEVPADNDLELFCSHDDDVVVYLNGTQIASSEVCRLRDRIRLTPEQIGLLRPGRNLLAACCHDGGGQAKLDLGLLRTDRSFTERFPDCARQTSVDVQATQTRYTFECGPVELKLTFMAPMLMEDLDLLSRPVNYITYEVTPRDGKAHEAAVYFEASPVWALLYGLGQSESEGFDAEGLRLLRSGSVSQEILGVAGDHVTIDWGYFYLAAAADGTLCRIGEGPAIRQEFLDDAPEGPLALRRHTTQQLALVRDLGRVDKTTEGHILLGYDDIYSIQYFGQNLRPWWNRDGQSSIVEQLAAAERDYASLKARCDAFDAALMAEAEAAGGRRYAELCAAAYRQAISAHKLVEAPNGDLLWLSKENFSNGSIGTVDVTYPSAPLFLRYNVELAKGLLNHIFHYSESGRWTKPFPAHDVGTYPLANGQTYSGDMPVEEGGNMLILAAAIARTEGNADYARKHWAALTTWADYLVEKGLDPENQLCTDDFAGHFAHNANLSVKAILGIAAYGDLARMLGDEATAEKYTSKARELAAQWVEMADDGDHYRLTFDQGGTWSQKYNLVWDKLFGWEIFPDEVREKEIAYYRGKQNAYGLPLDSRKDYTKTDWIMWTATLADDRATFEEFVAPVWKYMNETPVRVPMSDWIYTSEPTQAGFQARSVVGGYWIKMLESRLATAGRNE